MSAYTRQFAHGTWMRYRMPFSIHLAGAAMCSDGKVRKLSRIAETADTAFSVPAAVKVRGKTVSGYVTVETREGYSTDTAADPSVLKFVAVLYGKNHSLLPRGAWTRTRKQQLRREVVEYALALSRKARIQSQFWQAKV